MVLEGKGVYNTYLAAALMGLLFSKDLSEGGGGSLRATWRKALHKGFHRDNTVGTCSYIPSNRSARMNSSGVPEGG